jgi:hypothetical protein
MRYQRLKMVMEGDLDKAELSPDEKLVLVSALNDQKKERALDDFYFFCRNVLGHQDLSTMHEELTSFVTRRTKRGKFFRKSLILEPRDTFKTSVVTIGLPLWLATRDPNIRVLIDSEEYTKSKTFLRELKDHIVHNDTYRRLFGKLDAKKYTDLWQEAHFNVSTRTRRGKEPTFSASGIDVTKVGFHYDVIICDDLVSEKNITTPEQMEKTIRHFKLLFSLFDKGSPYRMMVVIGTRWHFADLYGYIMEKDQERVRSGHKREWRLFPERLDERFLDNMKLVQGSYIFSCQYLNDPAGAEDAAFKKEWIEWYTELPKGVPLTFGIVCDPSVGQTRDSDYSSVISVAIDSLNNWYVLSVMRGRWNPTEIVSQISNARRRVIRKYKDDYPAVRNVRVAMEVVAFQKVLKFYAKDLMRRKELERFRIIELKTDTRVSKSMRIRGLVPWFENRKIFFRGVSENRCTEGMARLVKELIQFPVGSTDDCLDALGYMPQIIRVPDMGRPASPKETTISRIKKQMKERREYLETGDFPVGSRIDRGGEPWLQL